MTQGIHPFAARSKFVEPAPAPSMPVPMSTAQSVLSTPPEQTLRALIPFRIQFSTDTVKPKSLPTFPYVVTRVNFDAIIYTARIMATDLESAIAFLGVYWPDADAQEAEEGVNHFHDTDTKLFSRQFGAVQASPPKRWWHLFRH